MGLSVLAQDLAHPYPATGPHNDTPRVPAPLGDQILGVVTPLPSNSDEESFREAARSLPFDQLDVRKDQHRRRHSQAATRSGDTDPLRRQRVGRRLRVLKWKTTRPIRAKAAAHARPIPK